MERGARRLEVAVFPLADAVLFPGVTLPIQFQEPGYREMLRDVRRRRLPLAVSLVNNPEAKDKEGVEEQLQLNPICGAGRIARARRLPDGFQEVLVQGERRVRLLKIIQHEPYLVMEAEPIEVENGGGGIIEFDEFHALLKTWAFLNPEFPDALSPLFDEFKALGGLTDFFAFHFVKGAPDKQIYLDLISPVRRAERMAAWLEADLIRLTRKELRAHKHQLLH